MGSAWGLRAAAREINSNDLIDPKEAGTLWGLFCERVRRSSDTIAYREYDGLAQCWRDHSWRMMAARTDRFRAAFAKEGLQPGDRIAVLLHNGIDWVCFDMAAHGQGLVVVALYPQDSTADQAYILAHSDARLALVDTWARWRALQGAPIRLSALARVWIREPAGDAGAQAKDGLVREFADVLEEASGPVPEPDVEPTALATLIYTSGTTGRPKGVMLSHAALLWNAVAVAAVIPPRPDDVFLSVLPLAHAFERTVGCYLAMMGGAAVAYARSPQHLVEDVKTIRPTVLLGVPRLFERIHAVILARGEANWIGGALLRLLASLGWRRFQAQTHAGGRLGLAARLILCLLDRWVGAPLLAAFGSRLRVIVSGGAPLDQVAARFLIGVGFPLVEGYGLTEAGPVVAATAFEDSVPGSVGRPLPGVEVKLGEADELLVRSPSLMMGYWKDKAETAHAFSDTDWLATGDIAEIKDGRIYIRGRLKEIIILSIGEKINPSLIEAEMARDALFQQVAVIGEGRPFLAVLAVLDPERWARFAQENQLAPDQPNSPAAKELVLARLAVRLATVPRYAQIHAVHLSLVPWTIDAGLLTPTLKVKREVLQNRFGDEIEALYAAHRPPISI